MATANTNYNDFEQQLKSVLEEDGLEAGLICINNFIAANPNSYKAYLMKSENYRVMGDFQNAFVAVEEAVSINPKEPEVYIQRGSLHIDGDLNKALNDFTKAIELGATGTFAYTKRGWVYLQLGEYIKAIDDCTKAIEISSEKEPEAHYYRGRAYGFTEKYAKALEDFNETIAFITDKSEAYISRAVVNSQLGNIQDAIRDYEKFLQLDPDNEDAQNVRDEIEKIKNGGTPTSLESDDVLEVKRELKVLLRLSVRCAAICALIGAILGVADKGVGLGIFGALIGMWLGIGLGCGLSGFYDEFWHIPSLFKERGFINGIKYLSSINSLIIWNLILCFVFPFVGPIVLLVKVLIKKHKI